MSGQSFMWRIQGCDDENETEVPQIWKTADKGKNNKKGLQKRNPYSKPNKRKKDDLIVNYQIN